jgi:hypothetical protein
VVAALDQFVACEIVKVSRELTVLKLGEGKKARYPRVGTHAARATSTLPLETQRQRRRKIVR